MKRGKYGSNVFPLIRFAADLPNSIMPAPQDATPWIVSFCRTDDITPFGQGEQSRTAIRPDKLLILVPDLARHRAHCPDPIWVSRFFIFDVRNGVSLEEFIMTQGNRVVEGSQSQLKRKDGRAVGCKV
jgi:hypothetical protein